MLLPMDVGATTGGNWGVGTGWLALGGTMIRCNHSTSKPGRSVAVSHWLNLWGEFYRRRRRPEPALGAPRGAGFRNGRGEDDGALR